MPKQQAPSGDGFVFLGLTFIAWIRKIKIYNSYRKASSIKREGNVQWEVQIYEGGGGEG
jgi:hypothetical protein